ncbi:MAG: hypothetical protein HRT72_02450 [Flavobacteriales bacterium]|nr:hypothetical protein [Flavobacteriales bacterium]
MRISSNKAIIKSILVLLSASLLLGACNSSTENEDAVTEDANPTININEPKLLQMDDAIFSLPSPIQTSLLILQSGASYNIDMLNSPSHAQSYSVTMSKALNLGIYGADLGYVTCYDQTQDALTYLKAIRGLADDLGVSSAFDAKTLSRFENNLGKKDSILSLVSVAYRAADSYLKSSERNDIGALVLAGGWIEGLYFITNIHQLQDSEEIRERIGSQKNTIDNLIKLLMPFYDDPDFAELTDQLIVLAEDFDGVDFSYEFKPSSHNAEEKVTTINSTSTVNITEEQIKTITERIASIRNEIVE